VQESSELRDVIADGSGGEHATARAGDLAHCQQQCRESLLAALAIAERDRHSGHSERLQMPGLSKLPMTRANPDDADIGRPTGLGRGTRLRCGRTLEHLAPDLVHQTLTSGHFMAEEAPDQITQLLRDLLSR